MGPGAFGYEDANLTVWMIQVYPRYLRYSGLGLTSPGVLRVEKGLRVHLCRGVELSERDL